MKRTVVMWLCIILTFQSHVTETYQFSRKVYHALATYLLQENCDQKDFDQFIVKVHAILLPNELAYFTVHGPTTEFINRLKYIDREQPINKPAITTSTLEIFQDINDIMQQRNHSAFIRAYYEAYYLKNKTPSIDLFTLKKLLETLGYSQKEISQVFDNGLSKNDITRLSQHLYSLQELCHIQTSEKKQHSHHTYIPPVYKKCFSLPSWTKIPISIGCLATLYTVFSWYNYHKQRNTKKNTHV